jgi:hypothetical protein
MSIVIVSSAGQCGVHECAQILKRGLEKIGQPVRFIGVQKHDSRDLLRQMRQVTAQDDLVIFEYEPGIFWPFGLVQAMFQARVLRGKKVILSVHEFAPFKFAEFLILQDQLQAAAMFDGGREWLRALGLTARVARLCAQMRLAWLALLRLPNVIIVHSPTALEHLRVSLTPAQLARVVNLPLPVEPMRRDRNEARRALGFPLEPFAFIAPGFIFRRKRIIEIIEQLPAGAELWVVGIATGPEADYLTEIQSFLAHSPKSGQVRLIVDYGVEPYIQAADAVVLFYREIFQSAVASQAVGAGKPCIFTDLPGFAPFKAAGLTVRTKAELGQAMLDIQDAVCYNQLVKAAHALREQISPEQIARRYLEAAYGS